VVDVRLLAESDREAAYALRQAVFQQRPEPYDEEIDRDYYAPLDRRVGAFDGDRLVGHLAAWDMGQWFGGRCIPMGGVAGVAVAPEFRGRGVASAMLDGALALLRDRGDAISTLYPANVGLYRSCGWEIAGVRPPRTTSTSNLARLPRPAGPVTGRRANDADLTALEQAYDAWAATQPGMLQRSPRYAARITAEREGHETYVAEAGGRITGYLWLSRGDAVDADESYATDVHEWIALDRDALVALWRMAGSARPISRTVTYIDSPHDSLAMLLHDPGAGLEVCAQPSLQHWMTRIVDVAAAVAARGYPAGARAEVALEITDGRAPWNAGPWMLHVQDGRGELAAGGPGDVAIDVGALAALYTGWADPAELARMGRLAGAGERDIAQLSACFTGRTPWMLGYF
jgi:predicted acetyltransferase